MDMIDPLRITRIKQITSGFVVFCCVLGLFANIFITNIDSFYNILLLTGIIVLFAVTALIRTQSKIPYILQVVVVFIIGIVTVIFGNSSAYIGDIIILTGLLLTYAYRLIKSYSYYVIIPVIVGILLLKGFFAHADIITSLVSGCFVMFIWTLLKNELNLYISESHKNESLARIGLNAGNFVHNLHLATIIKLVKAAQRELDEGDIEEVRHDLKSMNEWAMERKKLRDYIVSAVDCNQKTEKERINVNETINSVINTLCFNQETILNVTITTKFATTDVFMQAVPYEVYFILQNIMCNAVEAMLKMGRRGNERHKLFIQTSFGYHEMIVAVRDTGPGFPVKDGKIVLKSSKPNGGFGIRYINAIIRNYGGYAEFMNNPDMGATVRIHFKKYESKLNICFKDVEKKEEVEDIL